MIAYPEQINTILHPQAQFHTRVLDLFAGCGGLALGFEAQGFLTEGYEIEADCCATYENNLVGDCHQIRLTRETALNAAPVIIGGPPCQPFSVGGNQRGLQDTRDGFPTFIQAIQNIQPEIWLFENVRGLLYKNKTYFDTILQQLRDTGYIVEYRLLNALDFGVPQNRQRVIVVGHCGHFEFPEPQTERYTARDALQDMLYTTPPESRFLTESMDRYIEKYERASFCVRPRDLHLDEPARTLTCRNLAGATGDMHRIRLPDGRRRRLLVREAARLQSFPDWFTFHGSETGIFNQIGNAVPPMFAYKLAGAVKRYLETSERLTPNQIAARNREAERATPTQLSLDLF